MRTYIYICIYKQHFVSVYDSAVLLPPSIHVQNDQRVNHGERVRSHLLLGLSVCVLAIASYAMEVHGTVVRLVDWRMTYLAGGQEITRICLELNRRAGRTALTYTGIGMDNYNFNSRRTSLGSLLYRIRYADLLCGT